MDSLLGANEVSTLLTLFLNINNEDYYKSIKIKKTKIHRIFITT